MVDAGVIAGLVLIGVLLLLVIVALTVLVYLFTKKIKQQHECISDLEKRLDDVEGGKGGRSNPAYTGEDTQLRALKKPGRSFRPDSGALDLNDTCSVSTDGNSFHSNVSNDMISTMANKPRFTLIVRDDRVNIYGNQFDITQAAAMAQNYHNSVISTGRGSVSIDDMQLDSKKAVMLDKVSRVLIKKDVMEGRPTSLLLKTPQIPATPERAVSGGISHEKGMFVHRSIGQDGGVIEIADVRLEIPPGALQESKMITLGVTWDEDILPQLSKKQARISPVIVCQPSIKFSKPVKLTFPHCAVDIIKDWIPKVMKRQGDLGSESEWTNLTLEDYDEREVTASEVSLHLKHFTLYTLIGESKGERVAAKKIKLVAFAKPLTQGSMFSARIYCINDYDSEIKEIKATEKDLEGRLANAPMPLLFKNSGKDLAIALEKLKSSSEWSQQGENAMTLDFEAVWHSMAPYCNFVFDPKDNSVRKIYCEFSSYQEEMDKPKVQLKLCDEATAVSHAVS